MSTERIAKRGKLERGPGGKFLCRWCKVEVKPPRRTFCSDACVHEYKIRRDPGYVRMLVFERDKGICALCGANTELTRKAYYLGLLTRPFSGGYGDAWYAWKKQEREAKKMFALEWAADHVLPVIEGGGECGLENYRTLDTICHKKVTKALHARLAAKRSQASGESR